MDITPLAARTAASPPARDKATEADAAAMRAAEAFETSFLAEMLKAAGFGEQVNSFSGGTGEDQFASFHRQAIADKIAETGGIGLSEHFLKAMLETKND